jgi:hypothetical protein
MKKIFTFLLILFLGVSTLYSAPRVKIFVQNVTPNDLKLTTVLVADSTVSQGMKVVPKNNYVYLKAFNFGDTTSITSQTWTFLSKPAGSSATFVTIPSLNWVKFLVDSTGTYNVQVSITTSTGTKDTTMNIYSATYIGVGNFDGITGQVPNCMMCHSSMPTFQTIFNNWKETRHAKTFKFYVDSGSTSFGTSCMKCHSTGYDHNRFAVNGGFDDKARTLGWVWTNWSPPKPGNWDSLKTKYPNLVNLATVGCESCHGPGSEHYATLDTNKIDMSVSSGKCGKCHDSPWRHPVYNQWKTSVHANCVMEGRTIADASRNTFSDCNRCHDGEMYIGFTYGRKLPPNITTADQEKIGCASCHDPHGTTNDYSLRNRPTGSDTLSGGFTYPNAGTAKVCLDCHKARRYNVWYVQSKVTSSTWGPHESTQGDVLLGKNAATFNSVPYLSGSHSNISNLCVTCHMSATTDTGTVTRDKVGGHTWNLHDETSNYDHVTGCTGCHAGVTNFEDFVAPQDFDGNGLIESWQKEVAGCISKLGHTLPHTGYDTVSWQLIAADSNNVNLRKAFWNYMLIKNDKSFGLHNPFFAVQVLLTSIQYGVGVQNIGSEIPTRYELSQNYPNPFNPSTKINFSIIKAENVTLKVYDMMGREVISLVNQKMNPGKYSTEWQGINANGVKVASGVYFYRLITPNYVEVRKMVLLK